METRMKELIAIGASVTANCVPCLRYHLNQARDAGAEEDQIQAAVKVGRMVRKGAAAKWDEEAEAILGPKSSIGATQEIEGCEGS
jgi:AhpD family alkylhydroperoxidase